MKRIALFLFTIFTLPFALVFDIMTFGTRTICFPFAWLLFKYGCYTQMGIIYPKSLAIRAGMEALRAVCHVAKAPQQAYIRTMAHMVEWTLR